MLWEYYVAAYTNTLNVLVLYLSTLKSTCIYLKYFRISTWSYLYLNLRKCLSTCTLLSTFKSTWSHVCQYLLLLQINATFTQACLPSLTQTGSAQWKSTFEQLKNQTILNWAGPVKRTRVLSYSQFNLRSSIMDVCHNKHMYKLWSFQCKMQLYSSTFILHYIGAQLQKFAWSDLAQTWLWGKLRTSVIWL